MKRCPFCAEKIRKGAIKCKHCGEWLPPRTGNIEGGNTLETPNKEDRKNFIETNVETEAPPITSAVKHKEIFIAKSVRSEPSKYGWGWLLWLGLFLAGIKDISFSESALYLIAGALPLVSLILYFALRRRFLRKSSFPGPKRWTSGLVAGVVIYLLSIGLFSIMSFADGMLLSKKIESVDTKYKSRVAAFRQNEKEYEAKLINEPQTARHIRQNVKMIDAMLVHNKEKQRFFHEMLGDYRCALKGKRSKTGKKPLEQSMDDILSNYDTSFEKWRKAWSLLRTHYLTGNKKYYQSYTSARHDAAQSETDVQKGIREAFGTATIAFAE
jgi:CHASE3 domain sensor protein